MASYCYLLRYPDVLWWVLHNEVGGAAHPLAVGAGVVPAVAGALTPILPGIRTLVQPPSRPLRQIELQSGPEIKHFQQATKD